MPAFLLLDEQNLKDIGVSTLGARKKIFNAIISGFFGRVIKELICEKNVESNCFVTFFGKNAHFRDTLVFLMKVQMLEANF